MPNELTPEEKDAKRQAFLALDVKNEDFSKLPAQQTPPPGLSDDEWQEIARELLYLNQKLMRDELTLDDGKKMTAINSHIKNTQKKYNDSLKKTVEQYKTALANALKAVGYNNVVTFIEEKNAEQRAVQNERLTHNRQMLHDAVEASLENSPHIKNSKFKNSLETLFLQAFPDVNSKAKNKMIEGNKLIALQAVVNQTMATVDTIFKDYPVINFLPPFSETIRQLSNLISTTSTDTSKVKDWLKADEDTIIDLKLKEKAKKPLDAITLIKAELEKVADEESAETALAHIERILLSRK